MRVRGETVRNRAGKTHGEARGSRFKIHKNTCKKVILLCASATAPYRREESSGGVQQIGKLLRTRRSKISATVACAEAGEVTVTSCGSAKHAQQQGGHDGAALLIQSSPAFSYTVIP